MTINNNEIQKFRDTATHLYPTPALNTSYVILRENAKLDSVTRPLFQRSKEDSSLISRDYIPLNEMQQRKECLDEYIKQENSWLELLKKEDSYCSNILSTPTLREKCKNFFKKKESELRAPIFEHDERELSYTYLERCLPIETNFGLTAKKPGSVFMAITDSNMFSLPREDQIYYQFHDSEDSAIASRYPEVHISRVRDIARRHIKFHKKIKDTLETERDICKKIAKLTTKQPEDCSGSESSLERSQNESSKTSTQPLAPSHPTILRTRWKDADPVRC